ncbi:MAG: FAD-binding protein [Promicromonosporaceae bacterium]|nr:FAD-binding protein [Promicromonosporaceae bacterium]
MADNSLRIERADVVIVGGGAAGLRAALAAAAAGARVALVSKVYPMRSHTVAAEGGAAGVQPATGDTFEQHLADTLRSGAGLSHPVAVEEVVRRAPEELIHLERLGMPWSRTPDGLPAVRPFGGMSHPRTWYAADKTGHHLLHTLFQATLRSPLIRRYDEHVVLELLTTEPSPAGTRAAAGAVEGVVGYDQARGEAVLWQASTVILATGGYARAWGTSTNAGIVTGDGLTMALRAGLPLRDLEMVQVHPTGLPGSGILITEAARGEGGVLLDAAGERYLADYGLGPVTEPGSPEAGRMELGRRDALSQAFWQADRDGRTAATADGSVVYLDLRHLGDEVLRERLPLVRELARRFAGVDPARELIPVRPAAHYTMGGIVADVRGQVRDADGAVVAGLFAAGECASIGLHGANRLGSNSLVEALVLGAAAGTGAAQATARRATPPPSPALLEARARELLAPWLALRGRGTEPPAAIRREVGQVLDRHLLIFREAAGLQQAATALAGLAVRLADARVADTSAVWNTDWAEAVELHSLLTLARGAVQAALAREESRGAHQRLDFPEAAAVPRHSLTTAAPDGTLTTCFAEVTDA